MELVSKLRFSETTTSEEVRHHFKGSVDDTLKKINSQTPSISMSIDCSEVPVVCNSRLSWMTE